jgi:GTP-binding protein YchF
MALSCGIVGLPNVGKSTLFNCLTSAGAQAANYPFCTIEPNVGIVNVPDKRLDALADVVHPERIVPATMTFVDIAGLVKGASEGEGLGNQFLNHIGETNAICHLVRCFENNDVMHVEGSVNPIRDIEIIETELILKDSETASKVVDRYQKQAKGPNALAKKILPVAEQLLDHLNRAKLARTFVYDDGDEDLSNAIRDMHLLTAKPTLFVANVDEDTITSKDPSSQNRHLKALEDFALGRGDSVVTVCAKIEEELQDLDFNARKAFLQELGVESVGLERVIRGAFKLLKLITYFTAGVKEVRAWPLKEGSKAPQAAGVIHSDFERGFIKADVIWWEDFVKHGGEAGCRSQGLIRLEGKEYLVKDGDVMHFKFNV